MLFRCPSSSIELSGGSSSLCKPYLNLRSHVDPYLRPYYDSYAAPYVDQARPYIKQVEQQVYTPAINIGKQSYAKYGAPRMSQVRGYGQVHWEQSLKPQFDALQSQAKQHYDSSLAPHVSKVSEAALPYYTGSRDNVLYTYNNHVLPVYTSSRPHVERVYSMGRKLTTETGLPYAQWAWSSSVSFLDRTIWPKLRILYGENVEPQLVRIGERLGRYRDGKKLKAAINDIAR